MQLFYVHIFEGLLHLEKRKVKEKGYGSNSFYTDGMARVFVTCSDGLSMTYSAGVSASTTARVSTNVVADEKKASQV